MAKLRLALQFSRFLDQRAEQWLLDNVPGFQSPFLDFQVLKYHEHNGKRVRMIERINLVITAELPSGILAGFAAAQVDCDTGQAILHMVYTVPGFRRFHVAWGLVQAFHSTMAEVECFKIRAAVVSTAGLRLLRTAEAASPQFKYHLVLAADETIAKADAQLSREEGLSIQ